MGQGVLGAPTNRVWLRMTCSQNGLELSDEQIRLLERYTLLLLEWNKKINLISRRDEENFWTSHILHSISPMFKIDIPHGLKILDLGTGGGLPGIVWKIARPDLSLTLLDSTQKKINVVKDLIGAITLTGINAVWGRAEELGRQREHAGQYDAAVARAVAPLKDLVRWSEPFLKTRAGMGEETRTESANKQIVPPALIAFKGGNVDDEIGQLRNQSKGCTISTIELTLSGSTQLDDRNKKIIVVEFTQSMTQKVR